MDIFFTPPWYNRYHGVPLFGGSDIDFVNTSMIVLRLEYHLSPMNKSLVPIIAKSKCNELPRREIEGMIADGQFIIILDSKVLRLDAWIKFHPGGELAIKHMVGRDATDEVNAWVHS